jgi:hypothetical protein
MFICSWLISENLIKIALAIRRRQESIFSIAHFSWNLELRCIIDLSYFETKIQAYFAYIQVGSSSNQLHLTATEVCVGLFFTICWQKVASTQSRQ